jgi:hypothetical protein
MGKALAAVQEETGVHSARYLLALERRMEELAGQMTLVLRNAELITTLTGLSGVTIEDTVADNEMLGYDSASREWINQTAAELGLALLSAVVARPVVSTGAVSGWSNGDYYGQVKIFSDGGSPAKHTLYVWTSGTGGDDWLWLGERA